MKLQSIIFPKAGICCEYDMFFRANKRKMEKKPYHFDLDGSLLIMDNGAFIETNTYFNSFSIGKWRKYTYVDNVELQLDFCGEAVVTLYHEKYLNGKVIRNILDIKPIKTLERMSVKILFPSVEEQGVYAFSIEVKSKRFILYGGSYQSNVSMDKIQPVEIALNICNFNRERYIYRNMNILNNEILLNDNCELKKHLHIFVADNSKTVDVNKLPKKILRVFPQGDFGGAGGFTRGLIEILQAKKELALTHVVMMDDDILFEPECLERLYAFLSILKKEYHHAFINAALLRMDLQFIQTTNGGGWDMRNCYIFHKLGADLRDVRDVLVNEIEDGTTFGAWWFHCIPLTEISLDNLPYPFFFHMDDVEYDMHNCKELITLNGICVWHEPFENKPGSHLCYFDSRNVMIAHMLHYDDMSALDAWCFLSNLFVYVWYYRYKEAKLVIRGINDVLRGPTWLAAQNSDALLEDVLREGYRKEDIANVSMHMNYQEYLINLNGGVDESRWKRIFRRLSLNGYFFPSNHDAIIPMFGPRVKTTYRARRVLNYDPISERAYITEKSYIEAAKVFVHYCILSIKLLLKFNDVRKAYKAKYDEMTGVDFWKRYLKIDGADE